MLISHGARGPGAPGPTHGARGPVAPGPTHGTGGPGAPGPIPETKTYFRGLQFSFLMHKNVFLGYTLWPWRPKADLKGGLGGGAPQLAEKQCFSIASNASIYIYIYISYRICYILYIIYDILNMKYYIYIYILAFEAMVKHCFSASWGAPPPKPPRYQSAFGLQNWFDACYTKQVCFLGGGAQGAPGANSCF